MKRNKLRSIFAALVSMLFALCLVSDALPDAYALETDPETGAILISRPLDLLQLSRSCTVNTWSQGKLIRLTADIDLTGQTFLPIPIFSGEFSGEGYTISGLNITEDGSNMGMFRYVGEGAIIRSLHVSGTVSPGGDAEQIGGIAGVNAGSVLDCTFSGTVTGVSAVGGIVGENMETGEVSGCTMTGEVRGRLRTGGIAGRNRGLLLKCWNESSVNTAAPEESLPVSQSAYDTGGVAGISTGVIQSCTNIGTVGFPHTGYNLGGIVGRQSGYLAACENRGAVRGRKDVGGIAGQAEPDVTLLADPNVLSALRSQLNTLSELLNGALEGNEANRSGLSTLFEQLERNTNTARNLSRRLVDQSSGARETTVTNIRSVASSIAGAMDRASEALTTFSGASVRARNAQDQFDAAIGALSDTRILEEDTVSVFRVGNENLRSATEELSNGITNIRNALEELENAALIQDDIAQKNALWGLSDGIGAVAEAKTQRREALESMSGALNRGFPLNTNDVQSAIGRVNGVIRDEVSALRSIGDGVAAIAELSSVNWDTLERGLRNLRQPVNSLLTAVRKLPSAAEELSATLRNLEDPSGLLVEPMGRVAEASDTISALGAELETACTELYRAVSDLQETGPVSVTVTTNTEELRDTGNSLYSALATLTNTADAVGVAVTRMGDRVSANLQGISQQLTSVSDAMISTLENIQTGTVGADTVVTDVSEQNIDGTRLGKITECVNVGALNADRNVGGIAGIVGIEYDLDPEDDATGAIAFGSTLETRAIIQACRNEGSVTARKDCVGGLVGQMNLGTAFACENYGAVKSASGAYVGGLVGNSGGVVRDSWSRCTLSGKRYVGGIAGQADILRNCRAISTFADENGGAEYIGAIAGSASPTSGNIVGNLYLDSGVGGLDGVSYIGIAEPASWETLQVEGGPPEAFTTCEIVCVIDGVEVERIPFQYGDDLSELKLPEIPERANLRGYWPAFDTAGFHPDILLEPVYEPWVTMLASDMESDGRPLALAEGKFTGSAALRVTEAEIGPPAGADAIVMELRLTGTDLTDADAVPIRLLNATGGQGTVWRYHDSRWRTVPAETNGHYLTLNMEGISGTYCVVAGGAGQASIIRHMIPLALFIAFALIVAALVGRQSRNRVRRERTRRPNADSPDATA